MRYSCDQWALGERERPLAYPNPNVYTTRWLVPRRMLSTRCRYFPTAVLTLCRVISASYFDLVSTYNACKSTGNLVKQVTVEFIDTHEQRSYLLQESLLGTVGLSRYTDQCQKHGATYGNYLFLMHAQTHIQSMAFYTLERVKNVALRWQIVQISGYLQTRSSRGLEVPAIDKFNQLVERRYVK